MKLTILFPPLEIRIENPPLYTLHSLKKKKKKPKLLGPFQSPGPHYRSSPAHREAPGPAGAEQEVQTQN